MFRRRIGNGGRRDGNLRGKWLARIAKQMAPVSDDSRIYALLIAKEGRREVESVVGFVSRGELLAMPASGLQFRQFLPGCGLPNSEHFVAYEKIRKVCVREAEV